MKKLLIITCIISFALGAYYQLSKTNDKYYDRNNEEQNDVLIAETLTNPEEILLSYNEEGINLLKANYTEQSAMDLALYNIGKTLPSIKLKDMNGDDVNLDEFTDKNVVFEMTQANCSFCALNTPIVHDVLNNSEYTFVPIFFNSTVEDINNFYNDLGIELPDNILIDYDKLLVEEFGLSQTPTTVFVDDSSKISLIREDNYSENTFLDDLKLAFENEKIYLMKN